MSLGKQRITTIEANYKMFVDGKFNHECPFGFNFLTGYSTVKAWDNRKPFHATEYHLNNFEPADID